jgi:hypothetical protein
MHVDKKFHFVAAAVSAALVFGAWWIGDSLHRSFDEAHAATLNPAAVQSAAMGGRCTLTSGTPVMTANATSQTTMYYTPDFGSGAGNRVTLYNGSDLVVYEFSELSNLTTATTAGNAGPAAVTTSAVYDYFVWNNSGTLAFTRSPAWTSTTSRNLALSAANGIYVNATAITNGPAAGRGTYVCTAISDLNASLNWQFGNSTTSGTTAIFGVWNMYNRRNAATSAVNTNSTQYALQGTSAWRGIEGSTGVAYTFVRGLDEDSFTASYSGSCTMPNAARMQFGIGLDSATQNVGVSGVFLDANSVTATRSQQSGFYQGLPGLGYHILYAVEWSTSASGTCQGNGNNPEFKTGLFGAGRF